MARASRPMEIRTGCKEYQELPLDIKLLYYLAKRRGAIVPPVHAGVAVGLGALPAAKEILKWTVILAAIVLAIVFVSKKYKFMIEVGPDGKIKITGEPA